MVWHCVCGCANPWSLSKCLYGRCERDNAQFYGRDDRTKQKLRGCERCARRGFVTINQPWMHHCQNYQRCVGHYDPESNRGAYLRWTCKRCAQPDNGRLRHFNYLEDGFNCNTLGCSVEISDRDSADIWPDPNMSYTDRRELKAKVRTGDAPAPYNWLCDISNCKCSSGPSSHSSTERQLELGGGCPQSGTPAFNPGHIAVPIGARNEGYGWIQGKADNALPPHLKCECCIQLFSEKKLTEVEPKAK